MPSHTRRGAVGTTLCVGFVFVLNPRCADRCVLAAVVRRMVRLSVQDSIKLGEVLLAVVAVGEMSCCGSTGCLSCQGKQSTSSSSSSGRSLLLLLDLFFRFSVAGVSVGDSMRLLQLGTAVGRDAMAVGVEYHGGFGGMGLGNPMVVVVVINLVGV